MDELIGELKNGVKIGDAFECDVGSEEAYHFKEFGWVYLDPDHPKITESLPEKVKKCIHAVKIEHKNPLKDQ